MRIQTVLSRSVFCGSSVTSKMFLLAALTLAPALCAAQVVPTTAAPQVGSSNPASAEPPVARPKTNPCIVPLLTDAKFDNFSGVPIHYAPPAACPGPWAKVVLTADFTVTAGRQFDRSAWFYLGDVNIFYGTTAEPRRKLSPSWHIERDLTDLTATFRTPQTGLASIGNVVNSTYTGVIYANAVLEFYQATPAQPAPRTPDVVVGVSSGSGPGTLNTAADHVSQSVRLPRNAEKVYLDVISQSQIGDEFWYFCVPTADAQAAATCGNTAFRETEITIDGNPAGVAPVYPWIYTGGIDPYLWEPIVGVQTLNFKPYRVDLTPFAGVLADGAQHTVAISVFNANGYFLATGNLLVYRDQGSKVVTGGLISNTLTSPSPQVVDGLTTDAAGTIAGTVSVDSRRTFAISGFLNTSHGRVETTVEQKVDFLNTQTVKVNANSSPDIQNATQTSTVDSETTTRNGYTAETVAKHISFPLTVDFNYTVNADGSASQVASSDQQYVVREATSLNGFPLSNSDAKEQVISNDTLLFNANGSLVGPGIGKSTATYRSRDSRGHCFSRSLAAANQILTAVTDGKGCSEAGGGKQDSQ